MSKVLTSLILISFACLPLKANAYSCNMAAFKQENMALFDAVFEGKIVEEEKLPLNKEDAAFHPIQTMTIKVLRSEKGLKAEDTVKVDLLWSLISMDTPSYFNAGEQHIFMVNKSQNSEHYLLGHCAAAHARITKTMADRGHYGRTPRGRLMMATVPKGQVAGEIIQALQTPP